VRHAAVTDTSGLFLVNLSGSALTIDSSGAAVMGAPPHSLLHRVIGLREADTLERLRTAVNAAIGDHVSSVVLWRHAYDEGLGRLITVRPAREPGHAVVAVDPLDAGPSSIEASHLSELFGLSPSEAEIALRLAEDETVSAMAEARGVQVETVRGQIKSLLRKMGLSSQKQLVRVLTRIAAALE
jgi:DNA-binding CsgD family transcriptional regulator